MMKGGTEQPYVSLCLLRRFMDRRIKSGDDAVRVAVHRKAAEK
jgi:hypothetical protein